MITREELIVGNSYIVADNSIITVKCIGKHKIFYYNKTHDIEYAWHINDALKNLTVIKKTKKIQMVEVYIIGREIRHVEREHVCKWYAHIGYTILREYEIEIPE